MERRIALVQLFKLGDTPEVTMQKVLDLQWSHHTEDQKIGLDRYKENLDAIRLFFIYLVSRERYETARTESTWVRLYFLNIMAISEYDRTYKMGNIPFVHRIICEEFANLFPTGQAMRH